MTEGVRTRVDELHDKVDDDDDDDGNPRVLAMELEPLYEDKEVVRQLPSRVRMGMGMRQVIKRVKEAERRIESSTMRVERRLDDVMLDMDHRFKIIASHEIITLMNTDLMTIST